MRRQGIEQAQTVRTQREAVRGAQVAESPPRQTAEGQSIIVRVNSGGDVGDRPRVNVIQGSNVLVTGSDDPTENEVEITITLVGTPDVTALKVAGVQVVGAQGAAVADPSGGTVVDVQARAALAALLARARAHGLIGT